MLVTGFSIDLRNVSRKCRASSGVNAPELGALLSSEFGLSGESVRTRRALRCDDAERDPRVNREGCRQLGIASVVVMPVFPDGRILMIRQYRHAARQFLWELVAGRKDEGENFVQGAHRELLEETGYRARRMTKMLDVFPSPGFISEALPIVLAFRRGDEPERRFWRRTLS